MSFTTMGLSAPVMRAVSESGYNSPTEIQRSAVPIALKGLDIIGCAPTGTGKTAAFVLPILERLGQGSAQQKYGRVPRALVLTPTRELAQQIEDAILVYGKFTRVRPVSIYGGVNIAGQLRALKLGADIIVATPGRLLDHIQRRSITLTGIEVLVLDEADRMLDMGFINDVRAIIGRLPVERQTMLFSATITDEVRGLVHRFQKNPHRIDIGRPLEPIQTVTQQFFAVSQPVKTDLLIHILKNETATSVLVFSRTKHGADRIARRLDRSGVRTAAIHSARSQSQRQRALEGFKQRRYRVLVATDIAARGIDIEGISHVVNFDTPAFAQDYIHRIGRTGRAEATGTAFTFVSHEEKKYLRGIEYATGKRFGLERYPGFSDPDAPQDEKTCAPKRPVRFERRYSRKIRFF
jgi:ATP-dependent RNA helicase RhlE